MAFLNATHVLKVTHFTHLRIFPPLSLVTHLPALITGYTFSRPCHWSHIFTPLSLVTHFSALVTSYTSPTLVTGYTFSCPCHWLHVFPRLLPNTHFTHLPLITYFLLILVIGHTFSGACQRYLLYHSH